jgi:putative ABC transport system permease protein
MNDLFGIPLGTAAVVLAVGLAVALGVLAVFAARDPVLVRLGLRDVRRRRGRSALIVLGLMLGTTIIGAALTTGDTMSHTIRSTAVRTLGQTDEVIAAKGALADIPGELGDATGIRYVDAAAAGRVERALRGTGLADGVTPAIVERVALQSQARRRNAPRVALFAADPARMAGFGAITTLDGRDAPLALLGPAEVYLNRKAAGDLAARAGDRLRLFAGAAPVEVRVRDVVRYDGAGTADAAVLVPLARAQALLGVPRRAKYILVSNRGGATSGAGLSDAVVTRLAPVLASSGLEATTVKNDAIAEADKQGSAFMSFFTTFGSFSIAAGILLIFLIFVMLAAERRGELGIARAVGTRRGHLVEMFTFEGAAYDLAAAVVGALLGAAVAYGMVLAIASAVASSNADEGLQVVYAVRGRSLFIAFGIGVLITLAVVALSAWRVSRMTISAAIRNLPEPAAHERRLGWRRGLAALVAGLALMALGLGGAQATPLLLGLSLVIVGLVPLARAVGVPSRAAYTAGGIALVVTWMLPWRTWEAVFGKLSMDFSTWIVSGLMVVLGTVWTIMHNADLLSAAAGRIARGARRLTPPLRLSMAYSRAARFRTGTTLAMFMLVVFTLVTGTASSSSFMAAMQDTSVFGGGFDVRASTAAVAPIDDIGAAVARVPGIRRGDIVATGSQSVLAVDARQVGTRRAFESYAVRGLDRPFLDRTTFAFGAIARGYSSPREVWAALRDHPGLAVVDGFVVPHRDNFDFAPSVSDFALSGFYADDGTFDPVTVAVRDPQTGRTARVRVIGVLSDSAPPEMLGIVTSQRTLEAAFPGRTHPTIHYFAVAPGVDPDATATALESAFLDSGMEAESIRSVVARASSASLTFNRLIQGFMGLGLVVGVAALGVISARAVVERRQHIGVLRAVGFRRGMIQAAFMLESAVVALTAIVAGTALGILLAYNIVDDQRRQPSWSHLTLVVPWANLAIIFTVVLAVALAAALAPARRAARIPPAEALRYQ